MLAKTYGSSVFGVDASVITIEVNVSQGAKFHMVGLPDSAIKEVSTAWMRQSNMLASECQDKKPW